MLFGECDRALRRRRAQTGAAPRSPRQRPRLRWAEGQSDRPPDALVALTGPLDDPPCPLAVKAAGRMRAAENDFGGFGRDHPCLGGQLRCLVNVLS
jgi:hypothetical protein